MGYSCQKCKKKWGVTEFVAELRCPKDHLKSEKLGFVTEYGCSVCSSRKHFKLIPEMQFSLPNTVYVNLLIKLIQLLTFLSVNLVTWQSHLHSPNSCKMAYGLDHICMDFCAIEIIKLS